MAVELPDDLPATGPASSDRRSPYRLTGRVVTADRVLDPGYVDVEHGVITGTGPLPRGTAGVAEHWLLPGFVDMHVHGGGGHTYTTGDPEQASWAAAFHLAHGTTTTVASLVSAPVHELAAACQAYQPLVRRGVLAGVHLEGPYLARARCGAHDPACLRDPDPAELAGLIAAGVGTLRMMTLAPELGGALAAIEQLVNSGVVAAIGHTDASYEQCLAGIDAGATVATHLFNGMRPVHHRRPGPVLALLTRPEVTCELIADGHHLHDSVIAFVAGAAGARRAALVTDAIHAAGAGDGRYRLGGRDVTVRAGRAYVTRGRAIAGSTLTMDAAVRRAVSAGVGIVDASRMASGTPAAALGLAGQTGALAPGLRADLVELTSDLQVRRVMRGGVWT